MDMNDYQEDTIVTAIYPDKGAGTFKAQLYCAIGLANEAGELLGKYKKMIRKGEEHGVRQLSSETKADLRDELGDVLWYVARLADELEIDLSEVGNYNLAKLASRQQRGVIEGSGDHR